MDQMTFGLDPLPKKTRKEVFLDEMNQVPRRAALGAESTHRDGILAPSLGPRDPILRVPAGSASRNITADWGRAAKEWREAMNQFAVLAIHGGGARRPMMRLNHGQIGSTRARAIGYNLNRWEVPTRYIDDGQLPMDNSWVENQIRPIAVGRNNWLFAGSLRAGKRAAAIMSLIHSAWLDGHDPYACLHDILEHLPTQPASRIGELLPYSATSCPSN